MSNNKLGKPISAHTLLRTMERAYTQKLTELDDLQRKHEKLQDRYHKLLKEQYHVGQEANSALQREVAGAV